MLDRNKISVRKLGKEKPYIALLPQAPSHCVQKFRRGITAATYQTTELELRAAEQMEPIYENQNITQKTVIQAEKLFLGG